MRLDNYLNELSSSYGSGITFVDIDNTLFYTFAKINVIDDATGKVVKRLNNQEFNTYVLPKTHHFDFGEFRSAEMFNKTSIPIPKTVKRVKKMIKGIDRRDSKIIFLTARTDLDDKELFLQTFREHGIPVDRTYVERAGNIQTGTVANAKKKIIMKYINTGDYRRVRMLDDEDANLKMFLKLQNELPQSLIDKIKKKHNIKEEESIPAIEFFALKVLPNGSLKRIL